MKILFVCSGNKFSGPTPVVANQAESLISEGVIIDFFLVKGKGAFGYLANLNRLLSKIRNGKYDLIHAHSLTAFLATLTFRRPLVVSLLGSEVHESSGSGPIIKFLINKYWNHTIVKSSEMVSKLKIRSGKNLSIIPNGVNLDIYKPLDRLTAIEKLNWTKSKTFKILFLADIHRKSKNFTLAQSAMRILNNSNAELVYFHDIPKDQVPLYLNAVNVVLLTSLWEGSPNIIKEAMACNIPIVSTNVGDVEMLFGKTEGCFLTSFDPINVADKLQLAIDFSDKHVCTKGRDRIIELGLDSKNVAKKLIKLYEKVLATQV